MRRTLSAFLLAGLLLIPLVAQATQPVIKGGDSITIVMSGAIATTNPTWSIDYTDLNTGAKDNDVGSTNGVTAATMLAATTPLHVTSMSVFNVDTAAVTVTIKKVEASTGYTLTKATLAVGDTLTVNATGVRVTDSSGQAKTANVNTANSYTLANVTATTGGGTTGLIPAGSTFVVVASDDANKQISLPVASVGDRIRILVGATGCELISAVAAHKVNDVVVGATNEAALTALNLYDCQYVATNTWVVIGYTKLGAVQAALVPDSL